LNVKEHSGAVLAYSVNDPAGSGMARYLREVTTCVDVCASRAVEAWYVKDVDAVLAGFPEETISMDYLDEVFPSAKFYVFLSKHSAMSGIKSLTTHHTGNPTASAVVGGNPYELSIAYPVLTYNFITGLKEVSRAHALQGFEVVYEVTHHGPTSLSKPLSFIEIGSSSKEWGLREAHEAVGEVVLESLKTLSHVKCVPAVGFGGPHYAEKFTALALKEGICFGHIIPRYALKELRETPEKLEFIIMQAMTKSVPRPVRALVLKKVGSLARDTVKKIANELDLELVIVK